MSLDREAVPEIQENLHLGKILYSIYVYVVVLVDFYLHRTHSHQTIGGRSCGQVGGLNQGSIINYYTDTCIACSGPTL